MEKLLCTRYALANISAKLKNTSKSWIASIILVLNFVNVTKLNLLKLYQLICLLLDRKLEGLSC
jgi:hypothetical protein